MSGATTVVKIWDLPTRLFHWLLVGGIGFAWISAEIGGNWMEWHERCGIFLLSLVVFRVVWGLVGSDTSRFTQFLRSPLAALQYIKAFKALPSGTTAYHVGHNPAGAWMVVALLGMVLLQAMTGLFATDDIATEGPLSKLVSSDTAESLTTVHHLVFNGILLLAGIHIAAIAFYRLVKKTNLIKAMVVGKADWPVTQAQPAHADTLRFQPAWLGGVVFAMCYGFIHFGLQWLAA